jgi:hypothetical protein
MNPMEAAKLRHSVSQLRGLLRFTRRDNNHLRTLLGKSATYLAVVADDVEVRTELPELAAFVAHVREVLHETEAA